VTEGHPDKMCDQISDAILDAIMAQDPMRVWLAKRPLKPASSAAGRNHHHGLRQFRRSRAQSRHRDRFRRQQQRVRRQHLRRAGAIASQSPDIAQGVDRALEYRNNGDSEAEINAVGAGDQGMMFGFACNETAELMPLPIHLAHKLTKRLAQVRRDGTLPWVRPDGKSQVTVEYSYGKVPSASTPFSSAPNTPRKLTTTTIRAGIIEHVIMPVLPVPNW
jgi:S-adenosylmethionine synthetase